MRNTNDTKILTKQYAGRHKKIDAGKNCFIDFYLIAGCGDSSHDNFRASLLLVHSKYCLTLPYIKALVY